MRSFIVLHVFDLLFKNTFISLVLPIKNTLLLNTMHSTLPLLYLVLKYYMY